MKIFKFTEKKYLERFFADGSLRIGTLYNYRAELNLGRMVSDEMEGIKKVHGHIEHADETTVRGNSVLSQLFGGNAPFHINLNNCDFKDIRVECANLYVFCASARYVKAVHEAWFKQERYDACYEIASAQLFFDAITRALSAQTTFLGFGSITYYDSDDGVDINSSLVNVHPAALKRWKNFGEQQEIRGIWQPNDSSEIAPIIVKVPEAVKYCSIERILQ